MSAESEGLQVAVNATDGDQAYETFEHRHRPVCFFVSVDVSGEIWIRHVFECLIDVVVG